MKIDGTPYKTIWVDKKDKGTINIIDQTKLPFRFETMTLSSVEDVYNAIKGMNLRGAPLIGVAGAFGMYMATLEITRHIQPRDLLRNAAVYLKSSRPTAVNLSWAVDLQLESLLKEPDVEKLPSLALKNARDLSSSEVESCRKIGINGLKIIDDISRTKKGEPVNILTHCNAGWLACVDWGTATAPIYMAHQNGTGIHVWVDETRPRNQGSRLTAWELGKAGVPYTIISDNAGGHLMQKGMVDLVIVGCDRATRRGDVANKTGTYLKALAARDNNIPFYVALPTSSIDTDIADGLAEIEIEERSGNEVIYTEGFHEGMIIPVRICPEGAAASNYGFDITPAGLVTGLITEKGICGANEKEILNLFSEIRE